MATRARCVQQVCCSWAGAGPVEHACASLCGLAYRTPPPPDGRMCCCRLILGRLSDRLHRMRHGQGCWLGRRDVVQRMRGLCCRHLRQLNRCRSAAAVAALLVCRPFAAQKHAQAFLLSLPAPACPARLQVSRPACPATQAHTRRRPGRHPVSAGEDSGGCMWPKLVRMPPPRQATYFFATYSFAAPL